MTAFHSVSPMLKTEDMEATLAFYCELLGFTVHVRFPEHDPTFCILDRDGVSLSFYVDEDGREEPPKLTGQVYCTVSGVEELAGSLRGRTAFLWGPEVYDYGMREFAVQDPSGYIVTFGEPADSPDCQES